MPRDFDVCLLERVIHHLIVMGYDRFLCGMAVGFDLIAAACVAEQKKTSPVRLVACIPCATQSENFSAKGKAEYERLLDCCDEKIILSDEYFQGCMQQRNRYLVDHCDVLVTFLRRKRGGTYYTVKYAERAGKKIIEL